MGVVGGKRKVHVQRDKDGRIVGADGESDGEDQEQDDTDVAAESGMLWKPGEEAWEKKRAARCSFRNAHGHLAPRQDAVWGESEAMVPIGQYMANLRRKGGLGQDPKRAAARAAQLTEIDQDWNCPWSLNWQRHYRVPADLVDADGHLPYIAPGVTFDGDDIGTWRWLQQEPGIRAQLLTEQQQRLTALGINAPAAPSPAPTVPRTTKGPSKDQRRSTAALPPSHSE